MKEAVWVVLCPALLCLLSGPAQVSQTGNSTGEGAVKLGRSWHVEPHLMPEQCLR